MLLSVLLAGIGFPLVWGILGGSMPRSGGEYIYNSRILHPIIGIAESFGNAFVWLMWVYVLAPWMADPGLTMMAKLTGWTWLYDSSTRQFFGVFELHLGVFLTATVADIVGLLFVVFGVKIMAKAQKVVIVVGIGGAAVICVVLLSFSKSDFVDSWNTMAAKYHSLSYWASCARPSTRRAGPSRPRGTGTTRSASWSRPRGSSPTATASRTSRARSATGQDDHVLEPVAIIVPAIFMLVTAIGLSTRWTSSS